MLNLSDLFISSALAQDAAAAAPADTNAALMQYLPIVLIFIVFYLMVIRPHHKKMAEQDKMVKALQRGDRIITNSGIHGKITKLEGDAHLMIEIANGVEIKMERSHVQGLAAKTEPVIAAGEKK